MKKNCLSMIIICLVILSGCYEADDPLPKEKPTAEQYSLTIMTDGNGTTAPTGIININPESPAANVFASPNNCYQFIDWSVESGSAEIGDPGNNFITVTLSSDATIKAHFERIPYSLTVTSTQGGTIITPDQSPVTADCGIETQITAEAAVDYNFVNWTVVSGDAHITNLNAISTTVILNSDATIQAHFSMCSVTPTTVNASSDSICLGESTDLTVANGALGIGASWVWYTNDCGGTYIGTGSTINVTPPISTTYYVRAEGGCATTDCASASIIVNYPSTAATSAQATPSTLLCAGDSTELRVNGGSLGSGASWIWYEGSCDGSYRGIGPVITVSPTSTTTYYVRAEGNCNNTECVSVTVNVNPSSTAPTGINASASSVCPGASATLTVSGGSLGTGAGWVWYSGSCGGTPVGTGSSISPAISATTTFYVRAEGDCGITACAARTINVNTSSTAPTGINLNASSICAGDRVTLTVSGGSLGTGAHWVWYRGSCGGTQAGTGSSISPVISANTTFYVRAEGNCNTTTCASRSVSLANYTLTVQDNHRQPPTNCDYIKDGDASGSGSVSCNVWHSISADASASFACGTYNFQYWRVVAGTGVIFEDEESCNTRVRLTNGSATIEPFYVY